MRYGLTWLVGIPIVLKAIDSSLAQHLTTSKCLPLDLCKESLKKTTGLGNTISGSELSEVEANEDQLNNAQEIRKRNI